MNLRGYHQAAVRTLSFKTTDAAVGKRHLTRIATMESFLSFTRMKS